MQSVLRLVGVGRVIGSRTTLQENRLFAEFRFRIVEPFVDISRGSQRRTSQFVEAQGSFPGRLPWASLTLPVLSWAAARPRPAWPSRSG